MVKIYFQITLLFYLFFTGVVKSQTITTIAGTGVSGYYGENVAATIAQFYGTPGVTLDNAGNVVIADFMNNRIRKINSSGFISTIVGNGSGGYNGDNLAATSAQLYWPSAVAYDQSGNLYIVDGRNHRIRKVDVQGTITTIAGTGSAGYNGDNIPASTAQLSSPTNGVVVDAAGNIYFSDSQNNRVRKINTNGIISTIAGTGSAGYNGDGVAATTAQLSRPYGLAFDPEGNLYIADYGNNRVRKINTTGFISTVAGTGVQGFSGENSSATMANLYWPEGVAFDQAGNLYIADYGNNRVRKVDRLTNNISTIAGTGVQGYNGDNIPATLAQLAAPVSMVFDNAGNLYIGDFANNRIRKINNVGVILPLTLISFTAQLQNGIGLLQWQTSNEQNLKNFTIEVSTDGRNYSTLGSVAAKNVDGRNNYTYQDTRLAKGINYYRLRSIDKDGKSALSKIVTLFFDKENIALRLVPNPVKAIANLSFTTETSGNCFLKITDLNGRTVQKVNTKAIQGFNNVTLELDNLVKGYYIITVLQNNKKIGSYKFIKE